MFTKILVPLDGSSLSEEILPRACFMVQHLQAELILLKVVDLKFQGQYGFDHLSGDSFDLYLEEVRHSLINRFRLTIQERTRLHTRLAFGKVVDEILQHIEAEKVDLLMMTTHGSGGLSALVMGRVAAAMLQHCTIPVMLLRPDKTFMLREIQPETEPISLGQRSSPLVVALDGTIEAECVLTPVSELARKLKAPIHLIRVLHPIVALDDLDDWTEENLDRGSDYIKAHAFEYLTQKAEDYLETVQKRLQEQNLLSVKVVKVGEPAEEIIKYAKAIEAGLVAMASHGRSRVSQLLLGSVVATVTNELGLPVLLVNLNLFPVEGLGAPPEVVNTIY